MIAITAAVYFGLTTAERAEEWRTKNLRRLHLFAGIIILALGIGDAGDALARQGVTRRPPRNKFHRRCMALARVV